MPLGELGTDMPPQGQLYQPPERKTVTFYLPTVAQYLAGPCAGWETGCLTPSNPEMIPTGFPAYWEEQTENLQATQAIREECSGEPPTLTVSLFPGSCSNRTPLRGLKGFPCGSAGNTPATRETWAWSLGWEDPREKGKATHSSILAWIIPWTIYSKESDMTEQLTLSLSINFIEKYMTKYDNMYDQK